MATQYRVVYDNVKPEKTYTIEFGQHGWLWDREQAEKLLVFEQERAKSYSWIYNLYIQEREVEEEDPRKPMRTYEGKPVYNRDNLIWDICEIGDYIEDSIAQDILDALPPACMRSDCLQLGEPNSHINGRATYLTLKRVSSDVWEFCGYCFRGQNTEPEEKEVA